MGLDGRLVAEYAGSSKLLKRMSLIISWMNFGDMLDVAKWLRMRRKCPGRDLLLTARLPQRHRIARYAAVVVGTGYNTYACSMSDVPVSEAAIGHPDMWSACSRHATHDGGSDFRRGFLRFRGYPH